MNDNIPKIGIIGGAGVTASIELINRFEQIVTSSGASQNQHHPEIILYQATQAPSRSLFLENSGESFIPYYINAAKKLKKIGCCFVCMSCNTAHFGIDEISKKSGIEIIDMIAESFKFIAQKNSYKKIGIICTDGSRKQKLFDEYAKKILKKEHQIIYPNKKTQNLVMKIIKYVKLGKHRKIDVKNKEHPASMLYSIICSLSRDNCDLIILGCTEISLVANYLPYMDNIIDSMDILIKESLNRFNKYSK